jgi:gamma-glutamyltranspeptidase/glutathione hydrolase
MRLRRFTHRASVALLLAACSQPNHRAPESVPAAYRDAHPANVATASSAMVVTAAPLATRAGVQVLRDGGNAVDAAVAVAFSLAVVYPTAGNLGGGGFIVARVGGQSAALDFREIAPAASSRDMYLDKAGNVTDKSLTGPLAAGVPGSVAGLWAAHQKFGSRPWRELLQPAIELADKGFVADSQFVNDIKGDSERLSRFTSSAALFLPGGAPVGYGATWRNPDLAATLRRIAARGRDGFYMDTTADLIVAEMRKSGGIISHADLKGYEPLWRAPVEFDYRGHHVISMPPASSGGLTIALVANILSGVDLRAMGWHSPEAIRVIAEAERMAFARRNTLLADPAYVKIQTEAFLSPDTAAALRSMIMSGSADVADSPRVASRERHTTHFSVVDAKGNAVAMTTTINNGFGSAVTVAGAGFLLNDEMDDFTAKVGAINSMGLRQGDANAIQPGKRMLSSMSPTIVLDSAGAPMLVTGASGGPRIITGVLQTLINVLDYHMPLGTAATAPRFHTQDYPVVLELERGGYGDTLVRALAGRGQHPEIRNYPYDVDMYGWVQSILRADGRWYGVPEPRGHGLALGY